jgi:DNA transformation protein and related proteins
MASDPKTVDLILDRLSALEDVSARKMFGDYGLFLRGKMVGLICDDRLYFKPTPAGRNLLPDVPDGIPYVGARPCLMVPRASWDRRELLAALANATFDGLPAPKKKGKKG